MLNVGLTRTRVPTATPEDDRGEKAEPRRYALLTLIRHLYFQRGSLRLTGSLSVRAEGFTFTESKDSLGCPDGVA